MIERYPNSLSNLRVALAQVASTTEMDHTFSQAQGADLLVFPELFSTGYRGPKSSSEDDLREWKKAGQPRTGTFVSTLRRLCSEHRIAAVAGFLERDADSFYNSAVLCDSSGALLHVQRKRHPCFFGSVEEHFERGSTSHAVDLPLATGGHVRIGLLICMDREFPDVSAALSEDGAEVIVVPNSCRLVRDRDLGDIRLSVTRALAFVNATAVVTSNYPAPLEDGGSNVVDAEGRVVAIMNEEPGVGIFEIDLQKVREVRRIDNFRYEFDCAYETAKAGKE